METDIVAFSGGSGVGKSTLLLTLNGMQCPNGKTVTVMTRDSHNRMYPL